MAGLSFWPALFVPTFDPPSHATAKRWHAALDRMAMTLCEAGYLTVVMEEPVGLGFVVVPPARVLLLASRLCGVEDVIVSMLACCPWPS